jgi:hypothetical protein
VLTQVPQSTAAHQLRSGVCHEHLATVASRHDTRRSVHIDADISLRRHDRLAGMDADAHAHWSGGERLLGLACGSNRVTRPRKGDEECVALRVHLDTAVPQEGVA